MFRKNKQQSGFTLIELLVVIGIMGVLMAIAIPSEINYRLKSELKTSVKDLRSMYWDAQSYSLAPRAKNITAYEVTVTKSSAPASPLTEKECVALDDCPTDINKVTFGSNIYISDIKYLNCVSLPAVTDKLSTYFLVGDNKTSGTMSFFDKVGGNPVKCDKIEIIMSSIAVSNYNFMITLDSTNNSIDYAPAT